MADIMAMIAPYWEYLVALAVIVASYIVAKIVTFIIGRFEKHIAKKTKTSADDIIIDAVKKPIKLGIMLVGLMFALPIMPALATYAAEISKLFTVVFPLYGAYFASRLIGAILEWYTVEIADKTQTKVDDQFLPIIRRVIYAIVFGLALLVILGALGIEITTLIAAMGIGGLAIALALQPTLANFFSGMQMVLDRPIKIGDFVELDSGDKGTVVDIGWRSTRVETYTNNIVTIPNSKMADSKIINYNVPNKEIGFKVESGVAYNSDLEKVEKASLQVATQVLKKHDPVKGFEPIFRYSEFGDSSINFKVILRTKSLADSYLVKHEFIKALKKRFDKEGIEIPFPQTDVHFDKNFYRKRK
jgi:small-conductance mechanosensitive channel